MTVTVAICTWNRASLLRTTLGRLAEVRVPNDVEWEVLVVNNNSTDETDAVIEEHAPRLPIRRVFEAAPGHSNARNRAVVEARGDLIIWTDDDVLVDAGWISAYVSAYRENPATAFFAGPVRPWFEVEPPRWMRRHLTALSGVLVSVDHGPHVRPLQAGEAVFGANMAVRTSIARAFPFSPEFGRVKDVLTGGDDTDFLGRVLQAGHQGLWIPDAKVDHFVPQSRLTASYVNRWFRDAGRIVARTSAQTGMPSMGGVPRWVIRRYLQERVKAWVWRPVRNTRWFESYRQALILQGMILEIRNRRTVAPSRQ